MAVFSGWQADSGKVRGFDTETLAGLSTRDDVDIVLVEADGSRGLPLKAPALHEPCIPPSSQCVIAVSGGSAIGQTLGPETVHRWAEFSAITGAHTGEALTLSHLLSLICHPQGAFKNTPSAARRVWLVNRFYQSENLAADAFSALPETTPVEAIWLGAVQASPAIRYRLTASSAGHRMDT
jgi:probable selenium-dependent hydroxylase accessory protein YqeC